MLLVLTMILPVIAQEEPPGNESMDPSDDVSYDQVNAIAHQLYCPVCENIPLDVCPTQACEEWREDIREKLQEGWSEGQIKQYFVDRYGDRVLATPPARGFNWMIYIIPPVVIALSAIFLYRTLSLWRRQTIQSVEPKEGITQTAGKETDSDVYIRKMEEELRKQ